MQQSRNQSQNRDLQCRVTEAAAGKRDSRFLATAWNDKVFHPHRSQKVRRMGHPAYCYVGISAPTRERFKFSLSCRASPHLVTNMASELRQLAQRHTLTCFYFSFF